MRKGGEEMIADTKRAVGARISMTMTVLALASASVFAQGRGGGPGSPAQSLKAAAPVDMTGYWASVVVEDWRYRMLPPAKFEEKPALGARVGIPMNAEARRIALAWDPAKDE